MWVKCEFSQVDKTCTGTIIIRLILMADALIFYHPSNVTSGAGSGLEVYEINGYSSPYTYTMPSNASKILVGAYSIYVWRQTNNRVGTYPIAHAELTPGESKSTSCSYYYAGNTRGISVKIKFAEDGVTVTFTSSTDFSIYAIIYAFS